MGVRKCMCFGRQLDPGGNRTWTIIYFVSSWMTFLVAEASIVAGAKKNAYHTKYRDMIYAQNFSCETEERCIRCRSSFCGRNNDCKCVLYHDFTKATNQPSRKTNLASLNVGMTGYA